MWDENKAIESFEKRLGMTMKSQAQNTQSQFLNKVCQSYLPNGFPASHLP
jgi:hypothetical protein